MAAQESRLAIVIDVGDAERRIRRLREQLRELGGASDDTGGRTDDMGRRIRGAGNNTNALSKAAKSGRAALASMAKAASLLGAAVGGIGAAAILATADSMQILNNQIRVATDGAGEYAIAQSEIERIAMSTFSSLESVGQMYASNERALSSLGKSQSEVLLFTENISKAMSVSGGSAESQAAALTQLGQAMASGVLRGDEFNSIAEQAPVIMDLLTESLGVTRGELRAMAADGKLTAEIVYDAVSGASSTLDGMMGQTVTTMSQAMTNVKTQWALLADGLVNGEGGIGDGLASSVQRVAVALQDARVWLDEFLSRAETIAFIESLADNVAASWAVIKDAIGSAVTAISEFLSKPETIETMSSIVGGLEMAWDNLGSVIKRTGEILKPVVDFFIENEEISIALAGGIAAVASAFVIYNTAVIVGTAATAAFTAVLAFVTAPITLIVVAMTALVAAGIYVYRNWDEIKAKAISIWDSIKGYISTAVETMKAAFSRWVDNTKGAIINIKNAVIDTLKELPSKLLQIGKDIIQGLIDGIKGKAQAAVDAIKNTASNMYQGVKNFFVIRSPSRLMRQLGVHTIDGLILGIKDKESDAYRAAVSVAQSLLSGIESTQKEIALFGNNSSLASLLYDIENTDKYKDVSKQLIQQLVDETKALEQMNARAKAALAIQERFDKMNKDRERRRNEAGAGLAGVKSDLLGAAGNPVSRIVSDYERQMSAIREFEQTHQDILKESADKQIEIERMKNMALQDMMLASGEIIAGDMASIFRDMLGEKSSVYRAMFAIEKGFAITQAAIAIQRNVAAAMAVGFPQNVPFIAEAVSQGASLMSNIKGITAGFKQGGYTGNMGASQVAGVVHGQEYVFDAQSTKRIGVDNLNAMRSGKAANDSSSSSNTMNLSVVYNSTGDSQKDKTEMAQLIQREVKNSWNSLSNPNSHESKMVNRNVQAPRRR